MNKVMNTPYEYMKHKKTAVYESLSRYQQGHVFGFGEEWKIVGRNSLLNDADVVNAV